jgi:hypothetical protein
MIRYPKKNRKKKNTPHLGEVDVEEQRLLGVGHLDPVLLVMLRNRQVVHSLSHSLHLLVPPFCNTETLTERNSRTPERLLLIRRQGRATRESQEQGARRLQGFGGESETRKPYRVGGLVIREEAAEERKGSRSWSPPSAPGCGCRSRQARTGSCVGRLDFVGPYRPMCWVRSAHQRIRALQSFPLCL